MLAVGLVGAGLLMAFPGATGAAFLGSTEAGIWVFADCALLSLSLAIGALSWGRMTSWVREVGVRGVIHTGWLYLSLVLLSIIAPTVATAGVHHPIAHHTTRTAVLVGAVLLGAFPAFATLILIAIRFDGSASTEGALQPARANVLALALRARGDMQHALTSLASLIAGAVLATGAYRVALLAYQPRDELPILSVLAYGAYFTAVIAAVYIPTHLLWQKEVSALRDLLYPLPGSGIITAQWLEDRRAYESTLNLSLTAGGTLATALRVLAPLLAALVTVLFPASAPS